MEFNNNNITIKEDLISANQNNEVANNPKKIYIRNKKIYLVYIVMKYLNLFPKALQLVLNDEIT